jgi:hypothetical protein
MKNCCGIEMKARIFSRIFSRIIATDIMVLILAVFFYFSTNEKAIYKIPGDFRLFLDLYSEKENHAIV